MLDFDGYVANKSYFAASNGYAGFSSYFNEILNRPELSRLYILKGGPGTGKSSIMKALIKYANREGIYAEAIYCSSDASSLDGVILVDGDKSVAVVDGTAPHTLDPVYPGARDEIINLGDSFDIVHLTKYRGRIEELTAEKSNHYRNAYAYLEMAGKIHKFIREKYAAATENEALNTLTRSLLSLLTDEITDNSPVIYHVSAFGKDGRVRLENPFEPERKYIRLYGNGHTEFIVMARLLSRLNGRVEAYCPTPLCHNDVEAIYTISHVITTAESQDGAIDTSVIMAREPNLTKETKIYNELIELAKAAFSKAAQRHFELEDIYRHGMNFANNDAIFDKLIDSIERELA